MQKDIFIQARMTSSRLPGKVLKCINGIPILVRIYKRISRSQLANNVVVITSEHVTDDQICDVCQDYKIPFLRGHSTDLLDRHFKVANILGSDYVFKIPSDCPFSDPAIIDAVIALAPDYDYVSNYHPPTFPDGLDVEGARYDALEKAWKNAEEKHEREHTFPFIWDQPDKFKIGNLVNEHGNLFMSHRWTLDYQEDFEFIDTIYKNFEYSDDFNFMDILNLIHQKPEITKINEKYNGVNWYRESASKLKTVDKSQYRKLVKGVEHDD